MMRELRCIGMENAMPALDGEPIHLGGKSRVYAPRPYVGRTPARAGVGRWNKGFQQVIAYQKPTVSV